MRPVRLIANARTACRMPCIGPRLVVHAEARVKQTVLPDSPAICRVCIAGGAAASKVVRECLCEMRRGLIRKVFPDGHRAADSPPGRDVVTRGAFISS